MNKQTTRICAAMKAARQNSNLTVKQIADMCGTSEGYVLMVEDCIQEPAFEYVTDFCNLMGLDLMQLLANDHVPPENNKDKLRPEKRSHICRHAHPFQGPKFDQTYCTEHPGKDGTPESVSEETCNACKAYKSRYIEYPIQVSGIENDPIQEFAMRPVGSVVAIRPCSEELNPEQKTYLGIYLGELPTMISTSYNEEKAVLRNRVTHNPAIYVFELKRIVYGFESWWSVLKQEQDLTDIPGISDRDIQETWYVKLMHEMEKRM